GRRYYITTAADWRRHSHRFANSHWVSLAGDYVADGASTESSAGNASAQAPAAPIRILVLVEADESTHMALEDDSAFAPLPHPLAPVSISDALQSELADHGVPPGVTTFDAAEILARKHPLLRHRVF